jgi:hypothetical protein
VPDRGESSTQTQSPCSQLSLHGAHGLGREAAPLEPLVVPPWSPQLGHSGEVTQWLAGVGIVAAG